MSTCLSSRDNIKAKKRHNCALCGEAINPGDVQCVRTGVSDGDGFWTMHMHPECQAYELTPGAVDSDWYEDVSEPAFDRKKAIAHAKQSSPKEAHP